MNKLFVQVSCALALVAAVATPASAIECSGDFQMTDGGGRIATPYCEDNHLATVARDYGFKVNGATIRTNPFAKEDVCSVIGQDNRVHDTCDRFLQPGG